MAIKGKSRSRGAKGVTRGPKPVYVPVKTPLLRRRGFWIGVAVVLGVAAVAGVIYGFVQERNQNREEARQQRMATAVDEFAALVEPLLTSVGTSVPPTGFDAFPALTSTISDLEAGDVEEDVLQAARTEAENAAEAARVTAGRLEEVSANDFVAGRDLTREFVTSVITAHNDLLLSMDLYRQVGLLLTMAVEAEDLEARQDLVARADGVHDAAERAFARAYAAYVEAQVEAGTFAPAQLGPTTGPTG